MTESDDIIASMPSPKGTAGHMALILVNGHIKECADARKETNIAFRRVHARLDKIVWMIVTTLLALAGWGGNELWQDAKRARDMPPAIYQSQPAPVHSAP